MDIDYQQGLSRLDRNRKLYHDLSREFLTDNEHFVDSLQTRLDNDKREEAQGMIHTLKRISGTRGMAKLHNLSYILEEQSDKALTERFASLMESRLAELNVQTR